MLSTHSAPACGGKGGAAGTKGGLLLHAALARLTTIVATPYPAPRDCPLCRGQNKTSLHLPAASCGTMLSTHSPTALAGGRWCRQAPKGGAAAGGIYTGAAGAHHNPHGQRPCQTFEPFAPFEPSRPPGRVHAGAHLPCRATATTFERKRTQPACVSRP